MGLGRARNASPARVSRWRPRHCELFLLYEIVSAIPSLREDQLNEKVRNTEEFSDGGCGWKIDPDREGRRKVVFLQAPSVPKKPPQSTGWK